MAIAEITDLEAYCQSVAQRAAEAAAEMVDVPGEMKLRWLHRAAGLLREREDALRKENERDIAAAGDYGLTDAQIDRLRLTPERISSMIAGLESVAALPDPVGEVIESSVRPNGLEVLKVRVPLGVIFFIYESRPNVTIDAAALCVKSGNAVILRGGKEAAHSNRMLTAVLADAAAEVGLPGDAIQIVGTTDREAVGHFLRMDEYINVAIPRGGEGLIRRVAAEAKMPVLKHYDGNCHVYIDADADLALAAQITVNAKCQRMGVCNAAESLVVHSAVAEEFLPRLAKMLEEQGVEIRGDQRTQDLVSSAKSATDKDFATEYLAPIISVRVVDSLGEAIRHINRYGSHHTDAIVTTQLDTARRFAARVDSAAVMINSSTRFNDGGEFGLGAEIGISTDKFHARGPCGLKELTSYKYVVYGDGQIRE